MSLIIVMLVFWAIWRAVDNHFNEQFRRMDREIQFSKSKVLCLTLQIREKKERHNRKIRKLFHITEN